MVVELFVESKKGQCSVTLTLPQYMALRRLALRANAQYCTYVHQDGCLRRGKERLLIDQHPVLTVADIALYPKTDCNAIAVPSNAHLRVCTKGWILPLGLREWR